MRIADNMTYEQIRHNLSRNRSEMADLQNKAATQKRVTKPSDDPISAGRVLGSRIELQNNTQFVKNLDYANSFLEYTDQTLGELSDHLVRVKELALSQASDASSNEQSRNIVATEINQIYSQVVNVANRKLGERFIFGGFKTEVAPFDFNGKYNGDDGEIMINVDKGSYVAMNMPGSKIFHGKGASKDGVAHSTTRQAETIEDLLAQRDRESQPKVSNPNQPATNNQESNVILRGPSSVDGNNQQAQKSANKPDPRTTGEDIFSILKRLEISLSANDKAGIQDSLDDIDSVISQVVMSRAQVGARVMVLNSAMESLQKHSVDSNMSISQAEDADVFKVVSDINKTESTLKATLASSGKLMQPSLLEFLR